MAGFTPAGMTEHDNEEHEPDMREADVPLTAIPAGDVSEGDVVKYVDGGIAWVEDTADTDVHELGGDLHAEATLEELSGRVSDADLFDAADYTPNEDVDVPVKAGPFTQVSLRRETDTAGFESFTESANQDWGPVTRTETADEAAFDTAKLSMDVVIDSDNDDLDQNGNLTVTAGGESNTTSWQATTTTQTYTVEVNCGPQGIGSQIEAEVEATDTAEGIEDTDVDLTFEHTQNDAFGPVTLAE